MCKNLMIVESDYKIKSIQSYLGSQWDLISTRGHICDLPEKDMGVAEPDYRPVYIEDPGKSKLLKKLQLAVHSCDAIYLATDPDREGEAIAWHLERILNLAQLNKPVYRVRFHAINQQAVQQAVQLQNSIDYHLVAAQEARRVIDRLVGYTVSPVLGMGLSAGRVQSVALRIIVERFKAIEAFTPQEHYDVVAKVTEEPIWTCKWHFKPLLEADDDDSVLWTDPKLAAQVAESSQLCVVDVQRQSLYKKPPAPFETVTLLQEAFRVLGFNSTTTMQLAQMLYAAGWISYMRTDNPNPSPQSLQELRQYLITHDLPLSQKANTWKAGQDAQEGHEAIRPIDLDKTSLEQEECVGEHQRLQVLLYRLIYTRYLASQMADAEYEHTAILLESDVEIQGEPAQFSKTVQIKTDNQGWLGWLSSLDQLVVDDDQEDDNEASESLKNLFNAIKPGQYYTCECGIKVNTTKPPSLYSEGSFQKKLKTLGIGRPSTYANIIQTLLLHDYVNVRKKKLVPTTLGIEVVEKLIDMNLSFMEYDYTANMEDLLDGIAQQQKRYINIVSYLHHDLLRDLNSPDEHKRHARVIRGKPVGECQLCNKGQIIDSVKTFQCNQCDAVIWKHSFGQQINKTLALQLFQGDPVLLENLKSKKGKKPYSANGKMIDGKLQLLFDNDAVDESQENEVVIGECYCQPEAVIKMSGKKARCDSCGQWMWTEQIGHVFTHREIRQLFFGQTLYINGYQSRKKPSKTFGAHTRLEKNNGQITLQFE